MFRCLMFLGLSMFAISATAQDDADRQERIDTIIEQTRLVEKQSSIRACEQGRVLECLRLAGLNCGALNDTGQTICSIGDRSVYRVTYDGYAVLQGKMPNKWIVEILSEPLPEGK